MKKILKISDEFVIKKGWVIDLPDWGIFEIVEKEIEWDGRFATIEGYYYGRIWNDGKKEFEKIEKKNKIKAILTFEPKIEREPKLGDEILETEWLEWGLEW